MKYWPWIFAVAALWLMAAPFALGYAEAATIAMQNDVIVGAVMLIASFFWGYQELKEQGWGFHVQQTDRRQHT